MLENIFASLKAAYTWLVGYSQLTSIISDMVVIGGILRGLWYLKSRAFLDRSNEIKNNLEVRRFIDEQLTTYILGKNTNGIKDIGIRFIYWKNYPNNLQNDAYNHLLHYEVDPRDGVLLGSWIDNIGIFFQDDLSFTNRSIYYNSSNGIFYIDRESKSHKGFTEYRNKILIMHLPYSNIVNYDFRDLIEYEPVFYIKYKYDDDKLYSNEYVCRERNGDEYFRLTLDRRRYLKRSWFIWYHFLQFKLFVSRVVFKV